MQRFFGALAAYALPEGDAPLVVFVDEVDATRSLPFAADEFFGGVRECHNRRAHDPAFERLTFCLLGAAIPSDLIKETEASPFNVGERIAVKDFTREEAMAFAIGLEPLSPPGERGRGEGSGKLLAARVHHWTAGHPFLTQSLCRRLAETNAQTPADVDRLVEKDLFAPSARESNVNLADVGNRVLLSESDDDPERHRAEILSLYDRVRRGRRVEDDESSPRVAILKLSGLVVAEDGLLRTRNRIYERVFGPGWIAEHMPDGEARRVRRAYRRGLLRAAAVGAAMLAVVGALGVNATSNAHRAEAALAQARKDRDRALVAERKATASAKEATDAKVRAQSLAVERTNALTAAQIDRNAALRATTKATASAAQARVARADALAQAEAARVSAREARRQTAVAKRATHEATAERDNAQALRYASDMQLVSGALADDSGIVAASLLGEAHAPNARSSWAERRYRAVLDDGQAFPGHRDAVGRVAFAPNGDLLTLDGYRHEISGSLYMKSPDATVRRWSRTDGRLVAKLSLRDVPGGLSIDLARDGRTVAISKADGTIGLFSTDGFRRTATLPGNGAAVGLLTLTDVPGRAIGWQGLRQCVLDLGTGRPVAELELGDPRISNVVSLLPDDGFIRFGNSYREGDEAERATVIRRRREADGSYRTAWRTRVRGYLMLKLLSPDGTRLAVSDLGGGAGILDASTGRVLFSNIRHKAWVCALAFSPDGDRIATASEGTVKVSSSTDGKTLLTLPNRHGLVSSLAFSPDGRVLAVGNGDGTAVRLELESFATASGRLVPGGDAERVSVSRTGRQMAVVESGKGIALIDPRDGRRLRFIADPEAALWADLSADGETVAAVGGDGRLRSWRATDGVKIADVPLPPGPAIGKGDLRIYLSPDGRRAVACPVRSGWLYANDIGVWLLDVRTGAIVSPPKAEAGTVTGVAFSADGRRYVVAWAAGLVQTFDGATGRPLLDLTRPDAAHAFSAAYAPDGKEIAVGRDTGAIDVYDAARGALRRTLAAHVGTVQALAFSADGTTLVSAGAEGILRTWDRRTWRSLGSEPALSAARLFAARDGTVYSGNHGAVRAYRAAPTLRRAPAPPPSDSLPIPEAFAAARAHAAASGRNLLLCLTLPPDWVQSQPLTALLADAQVGPILRRRFEVFVTDGEYQRRVGGKLQGSYWRPFYDDRRLPAMVVLRPSGQRVWDDRPDDISAPAHGRAAMGVPMADWEIETFVRALRRGSASITEPELGTIRRFALRNGALGRASREAAAAETEEAQALAKRFVAALPSGRLDEEIRLAGGLDGRRGDHGVRRVPPEQRRPAGRAGCGPGAGEGGGGPSRRRDARDVRRFRPAPPRAGPVRPRGRRRRPEPGPGHGRLAPERPRRPDPPRDRAPRELGWRFGAGSLRNPSRRGRSRAVLPRVARRPRRTARRGRGGGPKRDRGARRRPRGRPRDETLVARHPRPRPRESGKEGRSPCRVDRRPVRLPRRRLGRGPPQAGPSRPRRLRPPPPRDPGADRQVDPSPLSSPRRRVLRRSWPNAGR